MPSEPDPTRPPATQLTVSVSPAGAGAKSRSAPSGAKGAPDPDPNPWARLRSIVRLERAVDAVQIGIALVLLVISLVVLVRTFISFVDSPGSYPQSVISAIDGVLVVIILVDVLRTVLTHFEGAGFPLQPFLIIGIISAVRDILSVSARLALQGRTSGSLFERSAIELGVSSAVALALAVAVVLTRLKEVPEEI